MEQHAEQGARDGLELTTSYFLKVAGSRRTMQRQLLLKALQGKKEFLTDLVGEDLDDVSKTTDKQLIQGAIGDMLEHISWYFQASNDSHTLRFPTRFSRFLDTIL